MHKDSTTIVESLPSIRTSDFKEWHTVSNRGVSGKNNCLIPYWLRYELTEEHLRLNYKLNGEDLEQFIPIIFKESNLGKGKVWFFKCPISDKNCRKLVLWNKRFFHQSNIPNLHYYDQTIPKGDKPFRKLINRKRKYERLLDRVNSKYSKWSYKGNLTYHKAQLLPARLSYMQSFETLSMFRDQKINKLRSS